MGIGASTGGVDAFRQLLAQLPPDTGMAYVLVQHLSPDHPSLLAETLRTATSMPVDQIEDGAAVVADTVLVAPPGLDVTLERGRFVTRPAILGGGNRGHTIDRTFTSLATRGSQVIGIILSGAGTDGVEGLRAIKSEGGLTFAQDPDTARVASMPGDAVAAGVVDHCMPPSAIAAELVRLSAHPLLAPGDAVGGAALGGNQLAAVLARVRDVTGADLSEYKPDTIRRRLARRMALRRMTAIQDYLTCLASDADEVRKLLEDVLIHVTAFFRDPATYDLIRTRVYPAILADKPPGVSIRIWVPGCSTGEEVYSLAMVLLELLGETPAVRSIQIFGSDLSEAAIARARAGVYAETVTHPIGAERLARFFTRCPGGHRVKQALRDLCVFVRHDVTRDPPFSRIDLVSCRNLLIYFSPALQRRVLTQFHYALIQPGFLVTGSAESVVGLDHLFGVYDSTQRVFRRSSAPATLVTSAAGVGPGIKPPFAGPSSTAASLIAMQKQVDGLLLARYGPAGVVVDARGQILLYRGHTSPYLDAPAGQPTTSMFKLARDGLAAELRSALAEAIRDKVMVRRDHFPFRIGNDLRFLDLEVAPLLGPLDLGECCFLVLFIESSVRPAAGVAPPAHVRPQVDHAHLEHELATTRLYMQSLVDELQHAGDELRATNEDLLAANEELQSTNEEMETAREELQATNEELTTINDQLQGGNVELGRLNDDMVNLLASAELPIVIVGGDRRIRRFTPRAAAVMNFIASDIGRPIDDLRTNLALDDLGDRIARVMTSGIETHDEVQERNGRWHTLYIRPYRTVDDRLDGVVVSLIDIDALKHAVQRAQRARDTTVAIVDAVPTPLLVLDEHLDVVHVNRAFGHTYAISNDLAIGAQFSALGGGSWCDPVLLARLHDIVSRDARVTDYVVDSVFPDDARRTTEVNAGWIDGPAGARLIVVSIADVTERHHTERERVLLLERTELARGDAERANGAKDIFLATLSHELRTPLSAILMQATMMTMHDRTPAQIRRAAELIERAAHAQTRMIDELLDVTRITTGHLELVMAPVDLPALVTNATELLSASATKHGVELGVAAAALAGPVRLDAGRVQQVVWNLVNNAIKFTPTGGRVDVELTAKDGVARLTVSDTGCGIVAADLERIFDRFVQAGDGISRRRGLGLGLTIARHLVEAHGGRLSVDSPGPGLGSTFAVELPLAPERAPAHTA